MRIRSIKPEFWRSDDIAALPISARLLFVGMWSYVDDNGVGSDKLAAVAADLFAPDLEADPTETFRRVSADTTRLEKRGLIVRYKVDGKPLLYVTNWEKHQLVKNPSLGHKYPLPPADLLASATALRRPSVDTAETLGTGTGEQGNRGTGDKNTSAPAVLESNFEYIWGAWPKKVERKKALEQFKIAAKKMPVDALMDEIAKFGHAYAATTERQFVPALGVWLSRERWTDELPTGSRKQTPAEQARRTVMLATELLGVES